MATEGSLTWKKPDGKGQVYILNIGEKEFVISITNKGRHRAGHNHKELAPHYVLSGKIRLDTELKGVRANQVMGAREIYLAKPNEYHLITAIEESIIIEEGGHQGGQDHPEWRQIVLRDAE